MCLFLSLLILPCDIKGSSIFYVHAVSNLRSCFCCQLRADLQKHILKFNSLHVVTSLFKTFTKCFLTVSLVVASLKEMMVLKALANEDTLLPTQMFPRLPARTTFVADTNFVSGTQKMFLILFRNILRPQQMFPSLRRPRNIMGNNVSATVCPRLPGP